MFKFQCETEKRGGSRRPPWWDGSMVGGGLGPPQAAGRRKCLAEPILQILHRFQASSLSLSLPLSCSPVAPPKTTQVRKYF